MPTYHRKVHFLLGSIYLYPITSLAIDLSSCFADVTSCAQNSTGCPLGISNTTAFSILLTSQGRQTDSISGATALSYTSCTTYCGTGQGVNGWNFVTQEYATWLLPYLALVSQLPFGARRRVDNLMSAALTLGSPTLAGYSLYMTLLNTRWVNDQLFAGIDYPCTAVRQSVVRVLSSLQQVPLRVHPGESGEFESLVVHPDNDNWWITFADELDFSHKWSIVSAASITWVIIAYLLAVANTLSNPFPDATSGPQTPASGLLGLLPIVVGWLVLSPKCDHNRVHKAYRKANRQVFTVDSDDSDAVPIRVASNSGLTIHPGSNWLYESYDRGITSPDELRTPPVFNYARILPWNQHVYLTFLFYCVAWRNSNNHVGVNGSAIPENAHDEIPRASRLGNRKQIISYCQPDDSEHSRANILWPHGLFFNMVVASLMSLQLQWGTIGATVVALWFTPIVGLGCRSLAYLIYGMTSTIVWMLLVFSSILGYYAQRTHEGKPTLHSESVRRHARGAGQGNVAIPLLEIQANAHAEQEDVLSDNDSLMSHHRTTRMHVRMLSRLADWLRWIGKLLAVINALGFIANSVFENIGLYQNCYCESNIYMRGLFAYLIIKPTQRDIDLARGAWIAGVALSLTSCSIFLISIYLVRDSLPS